MVKVDSKSLLRTAVKGSSHCLHPDVRVLVDAETGGRFLYNKDWFEAGRTSQVYAGLDPEGRPRLVKRLSLLEPSRPNTERMAIRESPHGGEAATVTLQDAEKEVRMLKAAGEPLTPVEALLTQRIGRPSKVFIFMRPAAADLLESANVLREHPRSFAFQRSLASEVGRQLIPQVAAMHARGLAHGDIKEANILCFHEGPHAAPALSLTDFGDAVEGAANDRLTLRRDGRMLGDVLLRLLYPGAHTCGSRGALQSEDLCEVQSPQWYACIKAVQQAHWASAANLRPDAAPALQSTVDAFLRSLRAQSRSLADCLTPLTAASPPA